ncbi:AraC family transcriptional regulator [Hymenobacter psychrophilus]|uniref:AraC-type DNA-binding protein n=1 Tax=Hymenobacter psychrophilus TaxID=651662 RepID=A0A1H3LMV6_9BACT|nr:helix-turn-helix domain-containing protein [Hymenobacter psychrophilus]SDY65772.1 AraC-type DNA-binding protein [Hymenobacter psychrophilus]
MSAPIPTYQLQAFAHPEGAAPEVFVPDYATGRPRIPLHRPYRGNYYKISLCLRGQAELTIDLAPYVVTPGCLVLATPEVIKQWLHVTDDYETLSVFFTREFITTHHKATNRLRFFVAPAAYVRQLSAPEAANIAASFRFLQQKYRTPHVQRPHILQNILTSLLYEVASIYDQPLAAPPAATPRNQALAAGFRQLVQTHCLAERRVTFYAAALCVTPKHLSALVKEATGRTARDWITQAVVLEAKTLLQNPTLPVYQVAASLQFADQFAFSRFFRQNTGLSPSAYRQGN